MPFGGRRQGASLKAVLFVEGAYSTMLVLKRLTAFVAANMAVLAGGAALAQDGPAGQPHPWQLGLQAAATPVMDNIIWFHNFLLWLIAAITIFVMVLLLIVIVRFNARRNPVP